MFEIVPTGTYITTEGVSQNGFRGYYTWPPGMRFGGGEMIVERYGTYYDYNNEILDDGGSDTIYPIGGVGFNYNWSEYKTVFYKEFYDGNNVRIGFEKRVYTTFRHIKRDIKPYLSRGQIIDLRLNEKFEYTKKNNINYSFGHCSVVLTKKTWGKTRSQYRADVLKALYHQQRKGNLRQSTTTLMNIFDNVPTDSFYGIP